MSDLNRNVPAKPVRRYKVTGTYEATFEIEVEANDEDDAVEKAKEGVEAGNHEVTDTGEIKVDDVEEVYGSSPRCPNCDQALDLEEY